MHFGRWEGLSWRQIARRFPRLSRAWLSDFPHYPIPDGEGFDAFRRRVRAELRQIVTANRGRSAVVVTHAGPVRLILSQALGVPPRHMFRLAVDPGALSVIDFALHGATVRLVNG
jgi:broad specificity phosphatase PhoE